MHDEQWFKGQEGRTVKIERWDKPTQTWRTFYRQIKNKKDAQYHFEMQSPERVYSENNPKRHGYKGTPTYKYDPLDSDEPVVRLHRTSFDDGCSACEA